MVNSIVSIKDVQDFKLPLKRAGPFLSRPWADPEGSSLYPDSLMGGMSLLAVCPSLRRPQGLRSYFSRPFSEAGLRGGQITANFPSPLLGVRLGAGSWTSAAP